MSRRATRLAAAATLLAAAAPAVVGGAAPAAGATTICVALVVDFTHIGGGVGSTCARVPAGSSGSDVLRAAGHRVTFDPRYGDDFICAIDGKPAGGCSSVDGTHYWAYYHRAPNGTGWTLSSEGAGTYQPRNASTEGWAYDDGSSAPPQPRNVPYGDICPRSSASPTPHATSASSRPAPATPPAATRAARTSGPRTAAAPRATPRRQAGTPGHGARPDATARTSAALPAATVRPSPPPGTAPPFTARRAASSHPLGSGAGVIAGLALVALLGGAAAWRARRGAR